MGVLNAVGKGFSLSRKLLSIIGIFFVFNLIIGLIMLPFAGPESANDPQAQAVSFLIGILSILIFIFLQGGALSAVRDLIKKNACNLADFAANGKKFYVKILLLFLIILAISIIAIIIAALISSGILAVANNTLMRSLITAIIVLLALFAVVILIYPIYVIVNGEEGPIQALKNGVTLSLNNFWKTFGLFVVLLVVSFVIVFLVGVVAAIITGALPLMLGRVIMLVVNSVVQSYLAIVMMGAFMSFYLGLASKGSQEQGPASA